MAIIDVKVPQLSESVSEATLLNWHKQVGEAVVEGENLIDVETDKVVLELPATKSGVLSKIIRGDGEKVGSDELIAQIDTAGTAAKPAAAQAAAVAVPPSVRKLAREHEIDAGSLHGSGRSGRVTKEDVLNAMQQVARVESPVGVPQVVPHIAPSGNRPEQRVAMTRIRQRIAERLLQSQQNAAILTTFNEVNMQPVMDLRARYKDAFEKKHGIKLGFSSFFVKAAVLALQKFPIVNASVDGTDIIYHGYFDIGMAIGSERGLVVPIIRDADKLSFSDIEKQITDFGARAKIGKLTMEELTGGTFSISNGGV
ncbi:MAG: 2-oxo acid dehydrogenase subunit E2, partial [Gallionella sp.]